MTEVLHSTFTLERRYPATPARVFAAWADPDTRARWFAGSDVRHDFDFQVGGREIARRDGKPALRFESVYHDIVPEQRIVYTSTLFTDGEPATVSLTTVRFEPDGDGTLLTLTEQGTFLDGKEQPDWREKGTSDQLDALAREFG